MNIHHQDDSTASIKGFFPTVRADLLVERAGSTKKYPVRLLLDSCSSSSFVEQHLANKLDLQPQGNVSLSMSFFTKGNVSKTVPQYQLVLESFDASHRLEVKAYGMSICRPLNNSRFEPKKYPHLRDLKFSDRPNHEGGKEVDILIGYDYYYQIVGDQTRRGKKTEPVAFNTIFGWALHGGGHQPLPNPDTFHAMVNHVQLDREEPSLQDCIFKMTDWAYHAPESKEADATWITPKLKDRYEVNLPWINEDRPDSNRAQVLNYQKRISGKLSPAEQDAHLTYFENFQDLGIVEECDNDKEKAWYLPYHGVWKRGKLRVVFDGSFGQPPLNKRLNTGPNLLRHIPVCLTSFRLFAIPITADIEKAYLQIAVEDSDREYLRFLVFKDGRETDFRFSRVPFGLNASPAILNTCLEHLYESAREQYPQTTHVLSSSIYMDDLVTSVSTNAELQKLKEESCTIFEKASMNLRGWTQEPTSILGVAYDSKEDVFRIPLQMKPCTKGNRPLTRRHIVSEIASIYDPMGWTAPWSVRLKWLIQQTWSHGVEWDTPLPEDITQQWNQLCELARAQEFAISRHVHFSMQVDFKSCKSHIGYLQIVGNTVKEIRLKD